MAANVPVAPALVAGHIGGVVGAAGSSQVRFSGGGLLAPNKRATPYSVSCYRPDHTNLRTLQTITDASKKPLPEASRLHLDPSKSGAPFTAWMDDVHRHCLTHGLDSCFYVLKRTAAAITAGTALSLIDDVNTTEHYLVKQWGQVNEEEILAFDALMRVSTCNMDIDNDRNCCEFLRGSISLELKTIIDQDVGIGCSAAYMLWKIIHKVQGTNSTAGRAILDEIQVMRLSKEPAFDVEKFCFKLHQKCTTLSGLGKIHLPYDFSVVIHSCFDNTDIKMFDLELATIGNALDKNIQAYEWTEIIEAAKTKYYALKNTKRWPPLTNAVKSKAAESGFAVQLKALQTQVSQLKVNQGTTPGGGKLPPKDTSQDTSCRYCKAKDHIIDNCPKLAAKNKLSGGDKKPPPNPSPAGSKTKHWTKTPPVTGAPHTQSVCKDGACVAYKWCSTCKRWRSGAGAHLTEEHKKKNPSKSPPVAGNTTQLTPTEETQTYPFGMWNSYIKAPPVPPSQQFGLFACMHTVPVNSADEMETGSIEYLPKQDTTTIPNPNLPWWHQPDTMDCLNASFSDDESGCEYMERVMYGNNRNSWGAFGEDAGVWLDFPEDVDFVVPFGGAPSDFEHGHYTSTTAILPWFHPKSKADYAVFNWMFEYLDFTLPFPADGVVYKLTEEQFEHEHELFRAGTLNLDYNDDFWNHVDYEYPNDFEGRRPISYYVEWYQYGRPTATNQNPFYDHYWDEPSVATEDYPEMDQDIWEDSDSESVSAEDKPESESAGTEETHEMDVDKHPKELPRCF